MLSIEGLRPQQESWTTPESLAQSLRIALGVGVLQHHYEQRLREWKRFQFESSIGVSNQVGDPFLKVLIILSTVCCVFLEPPIYRHWLYELLAYGHKSPSSLVESLL